MPFHFFWRRAIAGLCLLAWLGSAAAVDFSEVTVADTRVTVVRVDLRRENLRLFLLDAHGQPWRTLSALSDGLAARGQKLTFAMNAGMYRPDRLPVGLFVDGLQQQFPLNVGAGYGNFFLKPNGVFLLTPGGASVIETSEYARLRAPVVLATQSGPLLVRGGRIHPAFRVGSTARLIRNGVGVPAADVALFAISEGPINFHDFAVLFRDRLHCPDALYFDGTVSSLYAPARDRRDDRAELGPIIGVTQ